MPTRTTGFAGRSSDRAVQPERAPYPIEPSAPSNGRVHGGGEGRSWPRRASIVLPLLVVGIMVLSNVVFPLPSSSATAAHGATARIAGISSLAAGPTPTRATGPSNPGAFWGSDPSIEPIISQYPVARFPTAPLSASQAAAYGNVSPALTAAGPQISQGTVAPTLPQPSAASTSSVPLPLGPTPAVATVAATGYVRSSIAPFNPVSGALVTVTPVGAICGTNSCPPAYTTSTGFFTVNVIPKADQITVSAGYFVSNYTILTNVTLGGGPYYLGTIYLVPDGIVTGVVQGCDASHEPVPGVVATGTTRDGKIIATPSAITNAKGQFTVAVPPGPAEVQFTPKQQWGKYFGTTVFVDVQPGQTVQVVVDPANPGVVCLQVGVIVTLTPYNTVTGAKITGGNGYWGAQICARYQTNLCFPQGNSVPEGTPMRAVAPAGVDTLKLMADGYITNVTPIDVPQLALNQVYSLGKVWLIPDAQVNLWVNLTWANAAKPAVSKWGTGVVVSSTCSLDSYQFGASVRNAFGGVNMTATTCAGGGCATGIGQELAVPAAPLRNYIHIFPDTNHYCNPYYNLWPIPGELPVSDNYTYVNATPGRALNAHAVELTPGTYIQGTVWPPGIAWTATDCSTDQVSECFLAATNSSSLYDPNPLPAGCSAQSDMFCVPALPGPSTIMITPTNYPNNFTAVYNPPGVWKTMPLPMASASANGISTIYLSNGAVTGRVLDALSHRPVTGLAAIQVSPAGASSLPNTEAAADANTGYFNMPASPGWDTVGVTAPNYQTNRTWTYVGGGSVDVGTIYLTPESWIKGTVLGSNGYPINTTSVQVCPVTAPNACKDVIGSGGLTSTNGTFWQLVPAAHLPIGAYRIVANAPGYLSNQTWVNVTLPNETVVASTLILWSILATPSSEARANAPAPSGSGSTGSASWIYGRVVDNATGQGLPAVTVTTTDVLTGASSSSSGAITPDGFFNFSQVTGDFWINFTDAGYYYQQSRFVVVNGTVGAIGLGVVRMLSFHYLAGRLVIDPWRNPVSLYEHLGVIGNVEVCWANQSLCGATGTSDSGGMFNVSAPLGVRNHVVAHATGNGRGLGGVGFLDNQTFINVTENDSGGTATLGQVIYTTYTGQVFDASTNNQTFVRWGTVTLTTSAKGYAPGIAQEAMTGGGSYVMFLPPFGNITLATATASAYVSGTFNYTNRNYTFAQLENITPAQVTTLPNASLEHFGWLQFFTVARPLPFGENSARAPFLTPSANVTLKSGLSAASAPAESDGWGFVNMTAPPGSDVYLTVTGPDFNTTVIHPLLVNSSATTFVNGTDFSHVGNVSVQPWGWVQGTVWDPAVDLGVAGAGLTLQNSLGQGSAPNLLSNQVGTFFIDAPFSGPAALAVTATGYLTNNTQINVRAAVATDLGTVNMTGMGIVAGRVFGYPGFVPLYQAYVTICPIALPSCNQNVTTNGTGYFWVAAAPGLDVLNISIPGYAQNLSTSNIVVRSDTWEWAGSFVLDRYATVTGVVLGSPSGSTLYQANVSVCSVLTLPGQPTGPCLETVLTDRLGQFAVSTPPGNYILAINATYYNATYLPISLAAGEIVPIGTIFLEQWGTVVGTVLGEDTNAPVPAALVQACPLWLAGNCTKIVSTDPNGHFHLSGPPGEYIIVASASGYQQKYVDAQFVSGVTYTLPPIFLIPTGTSLFYSVNGTVTGGPNLVPLSGAVVTAGPNFATATDGYGHFSVAVPWGSYLLTVQQPGYFSSSRSITVHGDLAGLDFVLAQATYTVQGTVRDGLTSNPLSNVAIQQGAAALATTDPVGAYSLSLPNGTYTLTAFPLGSLGTQYAAGSFALTVAGQALQRDVQLFPPKSDVYGLVVNAVTGAALPNATVQVSGTTNDGLPWAATYRTSPVGTFVAPLFLGQYTLTASLAGFVGTQGSVAPSANRTSGVTLALTPISTAATTSNGGLGLGPLLVMGAVGAVAVVAYLALGRWRASAPERGPAGERSPAQASSAPEGAP
jgi:Carboxypeptidase regulatory-like domain